MSYPRKTTAATVPTYFHHFLFLGKLFAVKISQRNATAEHAGMRDDEIQVLIRFGQHPNIITLKGTNSNLLQNLARTRLHDPICGAAEPNAQSFLLCICSLSIK